MTAAQDAAEASGPAPRQSVTSDRGRATAYDRWALVLITLLALGLRTYRLGVDPYWSDEVDNLNQAEHIGAMLFQGEFVNNHPPLFATLLALWRALGLVDNEWTGKALPMLIGTAAVPLVYLLGARAWSRRAGLYAAFLLAISPFHIVHSQDLKDYILLPTVSMVVVLCLLRAMERNSAQAWAWYAASVAVACYSESFAALFLIALGVWFVCRLPFQRDRLLGWTIANAVGVGLFLPWAYFLLIGFRRTLIDSETWWIPAPTIRTVLVYVKTLAFGYSDLRPHFYFAMGLLAFAVAVGKVALWRRDRATALLVFLWTAVPPALAFAMSHVTQSVFLFRALLPFAVPVYLLASIGVAALPNQRLRGAGLLAFALTAIVPLSQYYRDVYPLHEFPHRPGIHPPADFDQGARYVLDQWEEGDIVVHTSAAAWMPFFWYGLRGFPQYHVATDAAGIERFSKGHPDNASWELTENWHPKRVQTVVGEARRVWLVFSEWEREYLPYGASKVYQWVDAHYTQVAARAFRGFDVYLYVTRRRNQPEVACVRRDLDDGVSAVVTLQGGARDGVYWKERPDVGIVRTPPADRQGRLVLRFDGPEPIRLDAQGKRVVGFAIDNVSRDRVACEVSLLASDVLVPATSLFEEDAGTDRWQISSQCNPAPPPSTFDWPVFVAGPLPGQSAWLHGDVRLPAGSWHAVIHTLGEPGDPTCHRADLRVEIAGVAFDPKPVPGPPRALAWEWRDLGMVDLADAAEAVPLRVGVSAPPEIPSDGSGHRRFADLDHLAFRRAAPADATLSPGKTALRQHETLRWEMPLPAPAGRVDVWVREQAEPGRTYHIFAME